MSTVIPIHTRKRDRLFSTETTHYLYANVSSWKYAVDMINPKEANERSTSRFHLDVITERSSVIQESMPLGLCIVCKGEDLNGYLPLSPWQLDMIPTQDEPQIPRCLEAVVVLEEKLLLDIRECLFLMTKSTDVSLQVILAIQENITMQPDDVAERSFAIVEFGYSLIYQKEIK